MLYPQLLSAVAKAIFHEMEGRAVASVCSVHALRAGWNSAPLCTPPQHLCDSPRPPPPPNTHGFSPALLPSMHTVSPPSSPPRHRGPHPPEVTACSHVGAVCCTGCQHVLSLVEGHKGWVQGLPQANEAVGDGNTNKAGTHTHTHQLQTIADRGSQALWRWGRRDGRRA